MNTDRIARIQKMEASFDRVRKTVDALDASLDQYDLIRHRVKELEDYLNGGQWLKDYEADERGEIPADLQRGVLSEDGLDNLLSDIGLLHARMAALTEEREDEESPEYNPSLSTTDAFSEFDPMEDKPVSIPSEKGNYIVVLRKGSSLPDIGIIPVFKEFNGYRVIYTGISKSGKGLRSRIGHDHFKGHSGYSTFRISLGRLMGFSLIHRDRIPDGQHYRFSEQDEQSLNEWMKKNLIVFYKASAFFEPMEDLLIASLNPPLNLDKNEAPVNMDYRMKVKMLRNIKPVL